MLLRGESLPAATLPDLARDLILTRQVNRWLGTNYTVEQVAEFPWLFFTVLNALQAASREAE